MTDFFKLLNMGGGDSFTDRLNSRYTCMILITMAILSSFKVYFTESISCKTPSQFSPSDVQYVNSECFHDRSYISPQELEYPTKLDVDDYSNYVRNPHYHLWIPLFMIIQAFLFYLPRRFWKQMGSKCGLSVSGVVNACLQTEKLPFEDVVERVDRFLTEASEGGYANVYLLIIYLITKVWYIINACFQILMMNMFLKRINYLYGLETLGRFLEEKGWRMSKSFPQTVMCDVEIRNLGNIHKYTIQCSMPINTFYEVVVTILWLWLLYVVVCSFCSFFYLLLTSFIFPRYREQWVSKRVGNEKGVDEFVRKRLGHDGFFLLRMVASNCNDVVASQLLSRLWQRHTQQQLQVDQKPMLKEAIYPVVI